jgi:hypothetical protein
MTKTITESGMVFISDNAFHIERSPYYLTLGDSVKSVELVRAKDDKLLFIEAKSSFPKPDIPDGAKSARFDDEIGFIRDKFIHSLNLYSAMDVGVVGNGFPVDYSPAKKVSLVFVLVINGFEDTWCKPIQDALNKQLMQTVVIARIWVPQVFVINDETAKKLELVS